MTSPVTSQNQEYVPASWRSEPIVHTATTFEDTFWAPRLQTMRGRTLLAIYEQMRANGHFAGFYKQWNGGVQGRAPRGVWRSTIPMPTRILL